MNYAFFIIGTGATGSQLIPLLTQLLNNTSEKVEKITFVDGDIIEEKNLKNQKFLLKDVGNYKSEVLAERYQRVYPELNLKFITDYVKSIDDLYRICSCKYNTIPVIVGCVDNIETRKVICAYVESLYNNNSQCVYIDSGNGTVDRNGQVVISCNVKEFSTDSKDFSYLPWDIYSDIKTSNETVDSALSCGLQVDKNPQNIATNILAATTIFMVITNLVMFEKIENNFIKFDANQIDTVSRVFSLT